MAITGGERASVEPKGVHDDVTIAVQAGAPFARDGVRRGALGVGTDEAGVEAPARFRLADLDGGGERRGQERREHTPPPGSSGSRNVSRPSGPSGKGVLGTNRAARALARELPDGQ